ncbi:hypothetical protein MGG_16099 [Pyricularia oryzae 70-15]|uniref:NAD(P)-binding domain-containing protein n=1 Tax=Pyricularia oryzae (strain 70-15 / ATCC MYA-4617 / FGSC 8958) TaxID=242507 RepID=G4MQI9_PYRO7|nr:uncharacterized protein MGG_16099 [Pyricularia oryzae 70-15]EHA56479.1 hypothetical protein MGG_16099 [Pyricularia oryzae 70-15]
MATKFIVFGPTGKIGSVAAETAHKLGAQVILAMRDTSKPIPGLDAAGDLERVQADLTDAASVRAALDKTGAKHAFIYLTHGGEPGMRSTVEALKAGGVEFVVFVSSFYSYGDDPHAAAESDDALTKVHSEVELSLHEVFGAGAYVALRPGYFASNLGRWAPLLKSGSARIENPDAKWDYISTDDIGAVAGSVGVKGPAAIKSEVDEGRSHIVLLGPQFVSLRDAARLVARATGLPEAKVEGFESDEEALKYMSQVYHIPEGVGRSLLKPKDVYTEERLRTGAENVQKFAGRPATTLEDWLAAHKELFM